MSLIDAVGFFTRAVEDLRAGKIHLHLPLEEIVIRECGNRLAYIDDRKEAKERYGFDLWSGLDHGWLEKQGISKALLYSKSQRFPDFLFKTRRKENSLEGGSIMELKDSKGPSIASFNSTIPTGTKTLEEIDVVNGKALVSKLARAIDREIALAENYYHFERKCFYLVRTQRENDKTKVSIIDGAFFETVPKGHLFYQMLLNVYRQHLEKKKLHLPPETLTLVEDALKCIDDQTIIAGSQVIEKASVRPRLRIMAEVHAEGNPHGSFYPEIVEGSFNLILKATPETEALAKELPNSVKGIEVFPILHKRNGRHMVFQYKTKNSLAGYL